MKLLCVILSFAVLLTGCYSHTTLTADSPQSTYEVSFRLKDGTCILSREYQRVESGYKVVGKLVNKENRASKEFSGIVFDEQITEVVTNEFSLAKTCLGVVLTVGVAAIVLYGIFAISWVVTGGHPFGEGTLGGN